MDVLIETKEETIDGLAVASTPLAALRAFALLATLGKHLVPLLKAVSPGMTRAMVAGKKEERAKALMLLLSTGDLDTIADALQAAFATMGKGEPEQLARDVLAGTTVVVDGQRRSLGGDASINLAFTGRMVTMFRVMGFALRVTYADFSSAASALSARSQPQAANPSS